MLWLSSADVRTKNGMSVTEPGFNSHFTLIIPFLIPIKSLYLLILYSIVTFIINIIIDVIIIINSITIS